MKPTAAQKFGNKFPFPKILFCSLLPLKSALVGCPCYFSPDNIYIFKLVCQIQCYVKKLGTLFRISFVVLVTESSKYLCVPFPITVYTFEDASHLWAFNASSTSTLTLSTTRYKDGMHSMKWNWTSGDELTHSFTSNVSCALQT